MTDTTPPNPQDAESPTPTQGEAQSRLEYLLWLERALVGMDEALCHRPGHNALDLEIDGGELERVRAEIREILTPNT